MLSLNKKVAHLATKDRSITGLLIGLQEVKGENVLDRDLSFEKANNGFAGALLDTTKRVVFPLLGGAAQTLPAASSMDVTGLLGATPASTAAPTYSAVTRTWSNLGAVCYAPDNKVQLRVPGPTASPDATEALKDANGKEVFARLTFAGGVFTLSFYHMDATNTAEEAYVMPNGTTDALIFYRQWVPGSSTLLEDQGRFIVSAPGAVDITESNNIAQLAGELGLTLGNDGALTLPFGKTFRQKWLDHLAGVAGERHTTVQIDATNAVIAGITGLGAGDNLDDALLQLQTNISAAAAAALASLQQVTKEFRSNGIVGTASPLSTPGANAVDFAASVAYVEGKRFVVAAQAGIVVANSTTVKIWVDTNGALQTGAAYPGTAHAKVGDATADGAGDVTITDEFQPLVLLDAKVFAVEALVTAHIASTSAHAAGSITFAPPAGMVATNVQAAIAEQHTRLNDARKRVAYWVTGTDIDLVNDAVADPAIGANVYYYELTLPGGGTYEVGQDMMEVIIDGDDQDLLRDLGGGTWVGVFKEESSTKVRIYFDSTSNPLVADQNIKLRWLNI